MSKPDTWMPLYVAKYLADTTLLTTEQHGAYLLLLFSGWMHGGSIPDRDDALAAATKMSVAAWRKTRPVLAPMFTIADGVWRQKRQAEELAKAGALYSASVTNGKKGGRPKKPKGNPDHNPEGNPSHNPEGTRTLTREKHNRHETEDKHLPGLDTSSLLESAPNGALSGKAPDGITLDRKAEKTKKLRADAVSVLSFLNEVSGSAYQPVAPNIDLIVARMKDGFTEKQCRQVVANRARQWKGDPKMDDYLRPKTLFNATNFANYAGKIVPIPEDEEAHAR